MRLGGGGRRRFCCCLSWEGDLILTAHGFLPRCPLIQGRLEQSNMAPVSARAAVLLCLLGVVAVASIGPAGSAGPPACFVPPRQSPVRAPVRPRLSGPAASGQDSDGPGSSRGTGPGESACQRRACVSRPHATVGRHGLPHPAVPLLGAILPWHDMRSCVSTADAYKLPPYRTDGLREVTYLQQVLQDVSGRQWRGPVPSHPPAGRPCRYLRVRPRVAHTPSSAYDRAGAGVGRRDRAGGGGNGPSSPPAAGAGAGGPHPGRAD